MMGCREVAFCEIYHIFFKVMLFYLFYFNKLSFFCAVVRQVVVQSYALISNKKKLMLMFLL